MAKRGRPISWQKAYSTYQRTVENYTKKLGTMKNEWYMEDFHQFKERVTSQREIMDNKWTVAKTVSYFAQKASLNEMTIKQIDELRSVGKEFGKRMSFAKAVSIFRSAKDEETKYIVNLVNENEWWDGDDRQASIERLSAAVVNGELTISEMYRFLMTVGISGTAERRDLISENVFGSY